MRRMMRAVLIATGLALVGVSPGSAQDTWYGLSLGMSRVNLVLQSNTLTPPEYGSRTGFLGALSYGRSVNDIVSLHSEIGLVERGSAGTHPDFIMRTAYLEVPLYIRLDTSVRKAGPLLSLLAGGIIAREVSCEGTTTAAVPIGTPPVVPLDCDRQRTDMLDVAALVGAGVGWRKGVHTWRLELRYTTGLSDISSQRPWRTKNTGLFLVARFELLR